MNRRWASVNRPLLIEQVASLRVSRRWLLDPKHPRAHLEMDYLPGQAILVAALFRCVGHSVLSAGVTMPARLRDSGRSLLPNLPGHSWHIHLLRCIKCWRFRSIWRYGALHEEAIDAIHAQTHKVL